jgi:hypothetical protein
MEIVLLQSAQADLLELYCRHGEASYHSVDEALETIRRMPEIGPTYHEHFRRKLAPGHRSEFSIRSKDRD